MREIASLTGALPFAGKHLVRKWYLDGVSNARNGNMPAMLGSVMCLLMFSGIHGIQLKMGIEEFAFDFTNDNQLEMGIDAGYTLANFLATYTQTYLAIKVLATLPRGQSSNSGTSNHKMGNLTTTELGITLGGQGLFISTLG